MSSEKSGLGQHFVEETTVAIVQRKNSRNRLLLESLCQQWRPKLLGARIVLALHAAMP
jgi:hypothetical protein